ncbi:cobalt-precorrin-6A reductase [Tumidithrix elongata RA019]|uniref:Cobalt-precorrin-6A reductase n=1 Tax=Tumidithrix elongata BACA0141 TaxID=2716417 RepID=A0AAW9Q0Z5_9CYAN|nr:cobalt-precorrin-6A reductase [Tumidithrix elongata RA019]
MKRLLILGGTGDAIALADKATKIPKLETISSLAGRTQNPIAPIGNVRIGGFGGEDGLTAYLQDNHIDLLIDATHPFAAQISAHAATATATCGIPHLILVRPPWQKQTGDRWIEVESHTAAAQALSEFAGNSPKRVFLTIGRQELAAFADLDSIWFLMRAIDPPAANVKVPHGKLHLKRGPFTLESERSLLIEYQIDAIVSKNSGGDATCAKIVAARELGIPVVIIQRPPIPSVEQVDSVDTAIAWLMEQLVQ